MYFKYFLNFLKLQLIYNVSSSSVVQKSDPTTHISLCCTVGSHCPSIPCKSNSLHPQNPKMLIHPTLLASACPGNLKSALLGHDLFLFFVCLLFLDRIICSIFQILQISNTIWYLPFSFWCTSLNMRVSRSILLLQIALVCLFYG